MNRPIVVAIGVCHRDFELACLWLRWTAFLSRQPGGGIGALLVVYTKRLTGIQAATLSECANGAATRISVVQCPDELETGYPVSASHLFLRTLEQAEKLYPESAILWCESDTVPMRPTWFAEIAAEYQTCGKPFMGAKVGTTFPHLAGNSVYPNNWRELAPSIANVLSAPDYKLWGFNRGQPWDVYCRHETTPQMAESKLWHHVWKDRSVHATKLKDIPETACVFHQDKNGSVAREIAALRYPEFMASLNQSRRFYYMNGHPSRLSAKGLKIKFSFTKYSTGGHRSAVCSDELKDGDASALAAIVGQLGVREIDEAEFLKVTGRTANSLPPARVRPIERADAPVTHPSVYVMLGRYGDICNILPMLKADADAGRRPTLVVSKDFADILDGVSYVDRIVWDGAYEQLPEALRWLRRDKGIVAPVVAQYHKNPFEKGRLTDSYMREVWRLASKLEHFDSRGPLVFDKRSELREENLVLTHGACAKPMILVGLDSISSPLANAPAILAAIARKFSDTHEVIPLSSVRADRIYDLIGLFDAAKLVIASDTAHIHLARASNVPLLALLNDGWRGSVTEHAAGTMRYANATPNAVVVEARRILQYEPKDTLTTMVWPRPGLTPADVEEMGQAEGISRSMVRAAKAAFPKLQYDSDYVSKLIGPKIYHVVDAFGSLPRHHVAQSTWNAAYAEGMIPCHFQGGPRNAKDELGDPRKLPFLKDVLWSGIPADSTGCGGDIVAWSNSDIGFKPGLAALIRERVGKHRAASMRRTESNGKGHPGRDLFAFTVDWLQEHWDEIPDYVLGAPVFDLGLVAMIRRFHGLPPLTLKSLATDMHPADITPGFALHESHEPEWQVANMDSVPSIAHNKRVFREWNKKFKAGLSFSRGGNLQ